MAGAVWDEGRLYRMIRDKEQESLTLDYKRSAALVRDSDVKKTEISKDVSALANADGGVLIYGMIEDRHYPVCLDDGCDPDDITKEWLEQIINSRIRPRIEGVQITQIALGGERAGRVAYAVEIPQARTFAPHQAHDKKYYKRFNFESVPMEDYEIRDALRRATTPDLRCLLLLGYQEPYDERERYNRLFVPFMQHGDYSEDVIVRIAIENRSAEPATYARITVDCPIALLHTRNPTANRMRTARVVVPEADGSPTQMTRFSYVHMAPPALPLWQGDTWTPEDAVFGIAIPRNDLLYPTTYKLPVRASAPGMQRRYGAALTVEGGGWMSVAMSDG